MSHVRSMSCLLVTVLAATCVHAVEPAAANASTDASANLLINSDFERIGKFGMPERWIIKQHAGVRAYTIAADQAHARGGEHSLKIHRRREQVWGLTEQIVPAFALVGKTVRFSVWVRSEDTGPRGAKVYLGAYDGSLMLQESRSAPITGNNDWTRFEQELVVPEYATHLQVGISLDDAGSAWIDDAELVVVDAATKPATPAK